MSDDPTSLRLALREIHGNVTVTRDGLIAWYRLAPQRWPFTTDAQRGSLIDAFGSRLTELAGHTVKIRVTSRPYPAQLWAKGLYDASPDALPGYADHLNATGARLAASTLAEKQVYLGVDLPSRNILDRVRSVLRGLDGARAEVAAHDRYMRRLDEIIGGPGMGGQPLTTGEVEWLLHRSIRLGLPAPTRLSESDLDWEAYDVPAFTEGVLWTSTRFGPTVEVSADYNGKVHTRHVAVLCVGRMPGIDIPQAGHAPWMQRTDRLGFPVEWASSFQVLAGPEVAKRTARARDRIDDQVQEHKDHGLRVPLSLRPKADRALAIEHETTEGDPLVAARCYGVHRIAVSGRDQEECLRRVQDVISTYRQQQITIQHPRSLLAGASQHRLLREFIPGEQVSTSAFERRLPAIYLAAGLPHVSATLGDRRGPVTGHTIGAARRPVMWDPHYAPEILEKSGLAVLVGDQGAGKSVLIGKTAYESARRGITTTIFDPSGPLAALVDMPALAGRASHVDLASGDPGILNPYAVIREPLRDNYATEDKWQQARVIAGKNRKVLAADVLRALLPAQVNKMGKTPIAVSNAIRAVGGDRTASLWQVIDALDAQKDTHSTNLANYLRDMAEMPQADLFFANHVHEQEDVTDTLLVLTMHGLELPAEKQDPQDYSTIEQLSVPLLHLAAHYGMQRAYGLSRHERKMIALDEAGLVARWGSGRALFNRLGRDTRKWNIAALVASQGPQELIDLDIANFISVAFVGRIEDPKVASAALRLLRVEQKVGYEKVIQRLSPQVAGFDGARLRGAREFVMKDALDQVDKMRVTVDDPELLAALDTTAKVRVRDAAAPEMVLA